MEFKNGAEFNNFSKIFSIHDDILEELRFERRSKCLQALNLNVQTQKPYILSFVDVFGYEMTACDFWGRSPHILDLEFVESDKQTLRLRLIKMSYDDYELCSLLNSEGLNEIKITFTSGDILNVVCKKIIFLTDNDFATNFKFLH